MRSTDEQRAAMARQRRIAGAGLKDFTVTKRSAVRDRFITGEHDVEIVETAAESRMAGLGGQFAKGGGRVPATAGWDHHSPGVYTHGDYIAKQGGSMFGKYTVFHTGQPEYKGSQLGKQAKNIGTAETLAEATKLIETHQAAETRMAGLGGQFAKGGGRVPAADGVRRWGADDQAEAEAFAQQTFEGTFGSQGLRAEVSDVLILPRTGDLRVQGIVLDASGNPVGKFTRAFNHEQQIVSLDRTPSYVEHVHLDLDPNVQGTGFSREFNAHAEAEYAKAGYEQVLLVANIDVGGYAWARQGFKINESHQLMADLSKDSLKTRVRDAYSTISPAVQTRLSALIDSNKMAELAADPDGKQILLGSSWRGVKDIQPAASESRMAGLGGQFAKGGGRVPAQASARKWVSGQDEEEAMVFATGLYDGIHGSKGYKSSVDRVHITFEGALVVNGSITTGFDTARGRKPIGKFTRTLVPEVAGTPGGKHRDPSTGLTKGSDPIKAHVSHDLLELDSDRQGTGFSQEFNARAEAGYKQAGYAEVHLTANIDVGGYSWARQGYTPTPDSTKDLFGRITNRRSEDPHRPENHLTAQDADALGGFLTRGDMNGIATYKNDKGAPTGKTFLLGSTWKGVKDLSQDAGESRMAGLGGQFAKGGGRVPAQAQTRKFVKGDEEDAMVMATAMYNGVHGREGYRTEVTSVVIHGGIFGEDGAEYGNVQIDGKIFDGKKEIGHFVSYIKPERPEIDGGVHREGTGFAGQDGAPAQVSHSLLELESDRQGNGFSRDFYGQAEVEYKKAGYNQIELTANIDVGGYAWARQGYKPTPKATADLHDRITQRRSEDRYNPENQLSRRDAKALGRFLAKGDMNGLAAYKNAAGEPTGKTFLLGSTWNGVKQI